MGAMGGNVHIKEITEGTENNTSLAVLYPSFSGDQKRKRYFINLTASLVIYTAVFIIFYFAEYSRSNRIFGNLIPLGLFIIALIIGGITSKKYYITNSDKFKKILTILYTSFIINLLVLVLFISIFRIMDLNWEFYFSVMFCATLVEASYFIIVNQKKITNADFFEYKNISFKYFIIDALILTFFCSIVILTNLISGPFNKKEVLLIGVIYSSWFMSAITTHKFLPQLVSISRWNAFGLQVQFYFKNFVLVLLFLILLNIEFSTSINIIKALIGYILVSSLISMFVFADKVENKIDDAARKFLKAHNIKEPVILSRGENIDKKYSYTGPNDFNVTHRIQFEYLKEYAEVFSVLNNMLDLSSFDTRKTIIIKSDEPNDISLHLCNAYQLFVNLHILNDQSNLNNYLRNIRSSLVDGGVFVGAFHPHLYRYNRFLKKYKFWIGNLFYFFDLIWKRVFPKLPITRAIYFAFKKDKDQAISLAEGLGRLVYTGYKIINLAVVNNVVYFAAVKDEDPMPERDFLYSPIIKLKRIGKNGEAIYVYKIRTMHPYSEYLQQYLIEKAGYDSVQGKGKLKDDFRVTFYGKLLRKYWLDEFPQLINVLKGEMKLIGLRPIGEVRFNEFPEDLKKERIKFKPGCIPPYVSLSMTDEKGNIEAERIYIKEKLQHPFLTDLKYFYLAVYNILIKRIRSA